MQLLSSSGPLRMFAEREEPQIDHLLSRTLILDKWRVAEVQLALVSFRRRA